MDNYFDFEAAEKRLDFIAEQRRSQVKLHLSGLKKDIDLKVQPNERPKCWKIIISNDDDEEAVFIINGIICGKDLPPIEDKTIPSSKAVYLRQSVDLTGLNSTSFCNSIDTIRTLHAQIDRYLPSNKLEKFSPDTYDKFDQLTISNRYFSPRNNSEQSSIVPFDHIIDPYKILSSFRLTNLIHTTDNEVLFYNSTMSPSSGKPKFIVTAPTLFREGDIVEIQTTIIAVPVKDDQVKLIFQLRSIALLDSSFTRAAHILRLKSTSLTVKPRNILKRKIGYDQEEEEEEVNNTRASIINMSMNETT